jgi:aldehyde dehydrogenase (NAD+)
MNVIGNVTITPIADIFAAQRATALRLRAGTPADRLARLQRLETAIHARRPEIYAALRADLRKSEAEADICELMPVLGELHHARRNLRSWMRAVPVSAPLALLGTQAAIRPEPKGVALIISPWNYPFGLTLGPLVSAIAAGCTAIIKPSEYSPHCSAVIAQIVAAAFDPSDIAVIQGGPEISTSLLDLPFDHIFFTGSPAIGKIVMAAAAKNLSSVTLELGGKSPVIVDASANLRKAAAWLIWGKFLNAGQTCIAPDHVFVDEKIQSAFLEECKAALTRMFGDAARSPDYCRIINARHTARLLALTSDAINKGARVVTGNVADEFQNFIAPTILTDINPASDLMGQEIFGPILPVIPYDDLNTVLTHINAAPKPLALYIYARTQSVIDRCIAETSSGSVCVNLSLLQFTHKNLPFGGVNNSGLGAAHGRFGFDAFSHQRAILRDRFSATPMLYPPYTVGVKRLIKLTLKFFT